MDLRGFAIFSVAILAGLVLLFPSTVSFFLIVIALSCVIAYWYLGLHIEADVLQRWLQRTLCLLRVPDEFQGQIFEAFGVNRHDAQSAVPSSTTFSIPAKPSSPFSLPPYLTSFFQRNIPKETLPLPKTPKARTRESSDYGDQNRTMCSPYSGSPASSHQQYFSSPRDRNIGAKTCHSAAGPTLASTRFKQNIDYSVYADVNSPGFSERIASYHQESNSEVPSSRFSSPGFFPSVHLVKDCVTPVSMSTRPKGRSPVGIRIAPLLPDYTSGSSVLEQAASDNPGESSTHSVLDALKEISRKRIQGGETDLDHRKRYKAEERERDLSISSGDESIVSRMSVVEASAKRLREVSPEAPKQTKKRICCNEIEGSLSSSKKLLQLKKRPGAFIFEDTSPAPRPNKRQLIITEDFVTVVSHPSNKSKRNTANNTTSTTIEETSNKSIDTRTNASVYQVPTAKSQTPQKPLFGIAVSPDFKFVPPKPNRPVFATVHAEESSLSAAACKGRELREKKLKALFSALQKESAEPAPTAIATNPAASLTSTTTLTSAISLPVVSVAQQSIGNIVATLAKTSEPSSAPVQASSDSTVNTEPASSETAATVQLQANVAAPTTSIPAYTSFTTNYSTDAAQSPPTPSTSFPASTSSSASVMENTNNMNLMATTDKDQSLSLSFLNQFQSNLNPSFGNFTESQSSNASLQPPTSSAFAGNTGLPPLTVQPIGFQPTLTQSPNVFAAPISQAMNTASAFTSNASAFTSGASAFTSTAASTTGAFGNSPFFGTATSSAPNLPTFASPSPMFGTGSIGNTPTSSGSAFEKFPTSPFGSATATTPNTSSLGSFGTPSMFGSDSMMGTPSSSTSSSNPQTAAAAAVAAKNIAFGSSPPSNPFAPAISAMATLNPFQKTQRPATFAAKPAVGGFMFGQSTPTSSGNVNQPAGSGIASKPTGIQSNFFGAPPNQSPFQQQMQSSSSSTFSAKPPGGFAFGNNNSPFAASQSATTTTSAPSTAFPPFAFGQAKPLENPFQLPIAKTTAQPFGFGCSVAPAKPQQAAFGFGNSPQQQQLQQQQQQSAPFGTNNTFAFGQAPAQQPPSQFQFGAPLRNQAPPGPSAAGGMFSIGTGAAPRQRALARRRKPMQ